MACHWDSGNIMDFVTRVYHDMHTLIIPSPHSPDRHMHHGHVRSREQQPSPQRPAKAAMTAKENHKSTTQPHGIAWQLGPRKFTLFFLFSIWRLLLDCKEKKWYLLPCPLTGPPPPEPCCLSSQIRLDTLYPYLSLALWLAPVASSAPGLHTVGATVGQRSTGGRVSENQRNMRAIGAIEGYGCGSRLDESRPLSQIITQPTSPAGIPLKSTETRPRLHDYRESTPSIEPHPTPATSNEAMRNSDEMCCRPNGNRYLLQVGMRSYGVVEGGIVQKFEREVVNIKTANDLPLVVKLTMDESIVKQLEAQSTMMINSPWKTVAQIRSQGTNSDLFWKKGGPLRAQILASPRPVFHRGGPLRPINYPAPLFIRWSDRMFSVSSTFNFSGSYTVRLLEAEARLSPFCAFRPQPRKYFVPSTHSRFPSVANETVHRAHFHGFGRSVTIAMLDAAIADADTNTSASPSTIANATRAQVVLTRAKLRYRSRQGPFADTPCRADSLRDGTMTPQPIVTMTSDNARWRRKKTPHGMAVKFYTSPPPDDVASWARTLSGSPVHVYSAAKARISQPPVDTHVPDMGNKFLSHSAGFPRSRARADYPSHHFIPRSTHTFSLATERHSPTVTATAARVLKKWADGSVTVGDKAGLPLMAAYRLGAKQILSCEIAAVADS
ncbi:uncharacterized protein CLUP02_13002 [Colletotrichum lupini]|uniref:Uncharacterized protein n=1 Tax=Colletotrichum lupini TaxID=145971 RepID=A0A9Q8T3A6_9PEZI|nr:uncharacterized protein CLUP02_13002 [Colletotrichum lupini]UQC87497.1 hypothetical protein CLUP02_13002 [Colletotrichum lupini]